MTISEQTLLEGAWWAIEQAGRLITAAVTVHDDGDPSTGAVLALFSREEVGRSKILRELAAKVRAGDQCTRKDLRGAVEQHLRKQEIGSHFVATGDDPQLLAAFHRWADAADHSTEKSEADDHLNALLQKKREDLPERRHKFRMASLYVDLDDTETGWKLPRQIDPRKAKAAVNEAASDYAMGSDALRPDGAGKKDTWMLEALNRMSERPVLAEPVWAKITD